MNVLVIAYREINLASGYGAFNKVGASSAPCCPVHSMNADFIPPKLPTGSAKRTRGKQGKIIIITKK